MADAPVAAEGLPEDEEKAEPAPAQVAAEEPSSPAPEDEKPPEVALEMPAAVHLWPGAVDNISQPAEPHHAPAC